MPQDCVGLGDDSNCSLILSTLSFRAVTLRDRNIFKLPKLCALMLVYERSLLVDLGISSLV